MLVKFYVKGNKPIEYSLPVIPRVGDWVELDQFQSGTVSIVRWHLGDELGFVRKPAHVAVILS